MEPLVNVFLYLVFPLNSKYLGKRDWNHLVVGVYTLFVSSVDTFLPDFFICILAIISDKHYLSPSLFAIVYDDYNFAVHSLTSLLLDLYL